MARTEEVQEIVRRLHDAEERLTTAHRNLKACADALRNAQLAEEASLMNIRESQAYTDFLSEVDPVTSKTNEAWREHRSKLFLSTDAAHDAVRQRVDLRESEEHNARIEFDHRRRLYQIERLAAAVQLEYFAGEAFTAGAEGSER